MITIKALRDSSMDFDYKQHEIDIDIFEDWAIDEDEINSIEDLKKTAFCIDNDIFILKKDELKKCIDALQLAYKNIEEAERRFENV